MAGSLALGFAVRLLRLAEVMGLRLLKDQQRFSVQPVTPAAGRAARKVLVVGGAGYIGSVLVRDLLAEGYRVRVLDSLACGDESISDLYSAPEFELVQGDLRPIDPAVRAANGI